MNLKQTPLYEEHQKLGATFVNFAGWEMPIQYKGIVEEHLKVRSAVGLFDVSHMGEIEIHGAGASDFCQKVTCNDITKLKPGKVQYTAILNEDGGMIDDCTVYMFHPEHFMFVINASRKENVLNWLYMQQVDQVEIRDRSQDYALIAVQGPESSNIVSDLIARDVQTITYYEFQVCNVFDQAIIVSRTGYTGEDGFEIYIPISIVKNVWKALLELGQSKGIAPIGLGARDTLRLEMGYRLYGNDMSEKTTPLEAGLSWIVDLHKGSFTGHHALKDQLEKSDFAKVRGLVFLEKGIPRPGYEVFENDEKIGFVTSGTYSPTLKKGIALAHIKTKSKIGSIVQVDVRGKKYNAKITKTPFVEGSVKK
ncbi:MAG: glycine cleavage system aminomethyltransferase GcvT [Bdellovibrionales bacterium]|nr:glycine cleavage system aminomethyltransferase GcvT [Bdellovibrionales bacterium]